MKTAPKVVAVIALVSARVAFADGWTLRPGDVPFTKSELSAFIAENEVRFYDGGRSEYGPGDAYAYVYAGGDRAEGRYRIEEDGTVCVDFVNGWSRCDLYVKNGGRVLLLDQLGERYPLKPAG